MLATSDISTKKVERLWRDCRWRQFVKMRSVMEVWPGVRGRTNPFGYENNQRGLAKIGGFAAHVGPGDE
jgi:hypothetical protein